MSRMRWPTIWQLLRDTYSGWQEKAAPRLGAALAFYSILSLVPLLLLVLSVASFFWGRDAAQGRIASQVVGIFGERAAMAMQSVLTTTSEETHAGFIASMISFATLVFSASGMFGELQSAMNIIWKVEAGDKPWLVFIRDRLFSFVMVFGSGLLLLASVLISTMMSAATSYIGGLLPATHMLMQFNEPLVSFGITAFIFTLIFKIVPDASIPWRSVWLGGILTALLFVIGKNLIGLYLGHIGIASTYGAAGSLVALLIWVYYSAQILFLGAEFTYVYSSHFKFHAQ